MPKRVRRLIAVGMGLISMILLLPVRGSAETNNVYGGTYTNWPTEWIAISNLNDPVDAGVLGRLDFVGDTNNPCGFWAADASNVYFRMRVYTNSGTTFSDSHFVMIDIMGSGTPNIPDWALSWDSKSADPTKHGLEMLTNEVAGTTWATTKMNDLDKQSGQKIAPPDFGVANGDGYVRTVGAVATTNFGLTTFIDFAASWNYLAANTGLRRGQTWRVQFASIENATDHNYINADIAANHNPGDLNSLQYWSDPFVVPESGVSRRFGTVVMYITH